MSTPQHVNSYLFFFSIRWVGFMFRIIFLLENVLSLYKLFPDEVHVVDYRLPKCNVHELFHNTIDSFHGAASLACIAFHATKTPPNFTVGSKYLLAYLWPGVRRTNNILLLILNKSNLDSSIQSRLPTL